MSYLTPAVLVPRPLLKHHCIPCISPVAQGGDLRTLLSSEEAPQWGSGGRAIALDIAEGLVFLHAKNITHRCARWRPVGCGWVWDAGRRLCSGVCSSLPGEPG